MEPEGSDQPANQQSEADPASFAYRRTGSSFDPMRFGPLPSLRFRSAAKSGASEPDPLTPPDLDPALEPESLSPAPPSIEVEPMPESHDVPDPSAPAMVAEMSIGTETGFAADGPEIADSAGASAGPETQAEPRIEPEIRAEPAVDAAETPSDEAEPIEVDTEPVEVDTEPVEVDTDSVEVETESVEIEAESAEVDAESVELGQELLAVAGDAGLYEPTVYDREPEATADESVADEVMLSAVPELQPLEEESLEPAGEGHDDAEVEIEADESVAEVFDIDISIDVEPDDDVDGDQITSQNDDAEFADVINLSDYAENNGPAAPEAVTEIEVEAEPDAEIEAEAEAFSDEVDAEPDAEMGTEAESDFAAESESESTIDIDDPVDADGLAEAMAQPEVAVEVEQEIESEAESTEFVGDEAAADEDELEDTVQAEDAAQVEDIAEDTEDAEPAEDLVETAADEDDGEEVDLLDEAPQAEDIAEDEEPVDEPLMISSYNRGPLLIAATSGVPPADAGADLDPNTAEAEASSTEAEVADNEAGNSGADGSEIAPFGQPQTSVIESEPVEDELSLPSMEDLRMMAVQLDEVDAILERLDSDPDALAAELFPDVNEPQRLDLAPAEQ